MKYRYLVFKYNLYHPSGGMNDISLKTENKRLVADHIREWINMDSKSREDKIQVYDHESDQMMYKASVHPYIDGDEKIIVEVDKIGISNKTVEDLTWHELQEFNELSNGVNKHGDFETNYIRLKKHHGFTDKEVKEACMKARRLMPSPNEWV